VCCYYSSQHMHGTCFLQSSPRDTFTCMLQSDIALVHESAGVSALRQQCN
jgi:hypothetical protein